MINITTNNNDTYTNSNNKIPFLILQFTYLLNNRIVLIIGSKKYFFPVADHVFVHTHYIYMSRSELSYTTKDLEIEKVSNLYM